MSSSRQDKKKRGSPYRAAPNTSKKSRKEEQDNADDEDDIEQEENECQEVEIELPNQIPTPSSSGNVAHLNLFPNLFYGEDEDDITLWKQKLLANGYKNEEKLCRRFQELYGNNEEGLIHRLKELSFQEDDAKMIAIRILSRAVYVPRIYPFTKSVADCTCPPSVCCPPRFLGVENTLNEAMTKITGSLPQSARTPPLMISRMSRGGKTTLLYLLFDKLQKKNIHPIFISFNGGYKHRQGLSQKQAILSLTAAQLTDPVAINGRNIICDEKELDLHLGDEPVVLLIDELNVLAYPIDAEAGEMLKMLFLDKPNRYLVFSTHLPMDVEAIHSPSGRQCIPLPFEPVTDLAEFATMGERFTNLNAMQVMLLGGVPSLLYSIRSLGFNPFDHFKRHSRELTFDENHFNHFLKSVMTGDYHHSIEEFTKFGIVSRSGPFRSIVHWPLCYITQLLQSFAITPELREVQEVYHEIIEDYDQISSHAARCTNSGKAWESVINIAISMRCLLSRYQPEDFPFIKVNYPTKTMTILKISGTNSDEAKKQIDDKIALIPANQFPVVLITIPTDSNFPVVDGIVAYRESPEALITYIGYQAKSGGGYPDTNISLPDWMTKCFLLRGIPTGTTKGSRSESRWTYYNKASIEGLLGYSLARLCPAELLEFHSPPEEEETKKGKEEIQTPSTSSSSSSSATKSTPSSSST